MSPREMANGAIKVMDLRDAKTGEFAYGKFWPVAMIVTIVVFHALKNPFPFSIAALLSATAIGPWAFIKFLERTSITVSQSRTEAGQGGVVSERITEQKGAVVVPKIEPGD